VRPSLPRLASCRTDAATSSFARADAKAAVIAICGGIALLGLANLVTIFMRTK